MERLAQAVHVAVIKTMIAIKLTEREFNHIKDLIELRLHDIQTRFGKQKLPNTIKFEQSILKKFKCVERSKS